MSFRPSANIKPVDAEIVTVESGNAINNDKTNENFQRKDAPSALNLSALPTINALEHYMKSPGSNQRSIVEKLHYLASHAKQVQKDSFEPPGQKKHHSASDFRPPMRLSDKKEKIEMPAQSHQFWRDKHVFAELDELRGDKWCHTHRWNYGLEEKAKKIYPGGEKPTVWGKPQIPQVSIYGLTQILQRLSNSHVMIDVPGFTFGAVVRNIIDKAIKRKIFPMEARLEAIDMLCGHQKRNPVENENEIRMSREVSNNSAVNSSTLSRRLSFLTDVLEQEYAEEAMLIKVAESDFMKYKDRSDGVLDDTKTDHRIIIFARLEFAVNVGMDVKNARFLVIVLGVDNAEARKLDIEIGGSFAALMQDEHICCAAYTAMNPSELRFELEQRVHKIKMVPEIHRPTKKGMKKREIRLGRELSALAKTSKQWAKWEARQNVELRCDTLSHAIETATTYAMPLLLGILLAMIWANTSQNSYDHWLGPGHHGDVSGSGLGVVASNDTVSASRRMLLSSSSSSTTKPTILNLHYKHDVTIHFIVNDIFMCFFFGLAVKEITEAVSPGGSMYPPREKAINPLLGTFGGVFGPVAFFFLFTFIFHSMGLYPSDVTFADVANGWGIPTATDISLAWVTAYFVFGSGHPAILYLLLLAIVDDGLGLIIIAIAYPNKSQSPNYLYLLLIVLSMLISYVFMKLKFMNWKLYIFIAGPVAWFGLMECSIHPALALVGVVPFLPNELPEEEKKRMKRDLENGNNNGHTDDEEEEDHGSKAPLHAFEHDLKPFVDIGVMFSFGLVNGGVQMKNSGILSISIFLSLILGKTLGIGLMSMIGTKIGYPPPPGIQTRDCFMIGFIASIGLTVALFVSGVAYPNSPVLEGEAKFGALLSILSAGIAILISKTCCKFSVPVKIAREKTKKFLNVDIDSESDDEEIDNIMVNSVIGTIRDVDKTRKALEKNAGMKAKVLADKERHEREESSKKKWLIESQIPNRAATLSNMTI